MTFNLEHETNLIELNRHGHYEQSYCILKLHEDCTKKHLYSTDNIKGKGFGTSPLSK